ncbi:TetR/AcrR family transcriptional regulator [Amycolatopsis sp. NPDC059657]|uniref:TetR/AcrR family transcriptional regulator n=1 Tax=Amycolatopsis sp. NPDC059657 TaxID=3346899 RepID=UPI0036714B46
MPRPKTHDEALRVKLLDRAGVLLSTEGPKALSLRKLAADVDTSTTAVYSLFGSKPDLVSALYIEGFRRFGRRLAAVPRTGDAIEDLVQLGLAYRASALADPHLYPIMFTKSVPGFEPNEEAVRLAAEAANALAVIVQIGVDAGVFIDVPPTSIAVGCWGIVHGLVTLELNGNLPPDFEPEQGYADALRANARGWLKPEVFGA